MRSSKQQSGFTIIELVTALAVVGIVLAIALPSFRDFVANNRLTTATNNLIASVSYARSEAVRRAQIIRIVATGANWAGGWAIVDQNGNTIRTFDPVPGNVTMNSSTATLDFDGRGLLTGAAAADGAIISICDNRSEEIGREVQISPTGRPLLNRKHTCM